MCTLNHVLGYPHSKNVALELIGIAVVVIGAAENKAGEMSKPKAFNKKGNSRFSIILRNFRTPL